MNQVKCKVVMLATEKASQILLSKSDNKLYYSSIKTRQDTTFQPHHLYILSDEEIKEGDWCYHLGLNRIEKWNKSEDFDKSLRRKIIASTDQSLGLPRPSDSFIKKYCELGGIEEVLVEYEEIRTNPDEPNSYALYKYKLKVAPDNTITIKAVKDNWNREEVVALLNRALEFNRPNNDGYPGLISGWNKTKLDWIKENL